MDSACTYSALVECDSEVVEENHKLLVSDSCSKHCESIARWQNYWCDFGHTQPCSKIVIPSLFQWRMLFLKMLGYIEYWGCISCRRCDTSKIKTINLTIWYYTCQSQVGIVANSLVVQQLCVTSGCTPPTHPWDSTYRITGSDSSWEQGVHAWRGFINRIIPVSRCLCGMLLTVAQLYLDAAVVCREPVVLHWDRSGINLSIYDCQHIMHELVTPTLEYVICWLNVSLTWVIQYVAVPIQGAWRCWYALQLRLDDSPMVPDPLTFTWVVVFFLECVAWQQVFIIIALPLSTI